MVKYEQETKIDIYRSKYNKIKEYALSNNWFVLEDVKEDNDNWPSINYLTPPGLLVEISLDNDGLLINNELGEERER